MRLLLGTNNPDATLDALAVYNGISKQEMELYIERLEVKIIERREVCDGELSTLSREELIAEVVGLRNIIREHRDQRGDDRCWLDDFLLYAALPDRIPALSTLPPKEVFMPSCERFHDTRQCPLKLEELHQW